MILTLGILCVCVCADTHLRGSLNQNLISVSYWLLQAVAIVMTNRRKRFHRFFSQNMWLSHLFLCPPVCSQYTITACLHGNGLWAIPHTSLHSAYVLCVPLCTQCYHKASQNHTCPVSWFCVPGNLLSLSYSQASADNSCSKNCTCLSCPSASSTYWFSPTHVSCM